ncbi:hypothetical protein EJ08DRAFT_583228 [Tothia fuscella]|uniref:Rhodanese domain-containing protein n=1 Tax=Tothia fuscella TaxID=1048955 RepID=A0A9P4U1R0_9PEZI|nr:hypothetical protein EJ08DRAFT_583228 [Tothia fuscella]
MGVEGYIPQDWGKIESLSPEEFHERCYQEDILLMDVRNHYESKIGYFIDPKTGTVATRPPIRRFSQWPQYIKAHANDINGGKKKNIMTYCTGGIRCEKAVRWMQENTKQDDDTRIFTLEGGIAAYFDWMEGEIRTGRKQPKDSLFKGLNYVFDARASTRLTESTELVSRCHSCDQPTGHLAKCHSRRCHLVLVMCPDCNGKDVRCCLDCKQQDNNELAVEVEQKTSRGLCSCEREREYQLWGGEPVSKKSRKTAAKTSQKHKSGKSININVDVDPI